MTLFEDLPVEVQEVIRDAYEACCIFILAKKPIPYKFVCRRLIKNIEALWPKQFEEEK